MSDYPCRAFPRCGRIAALCAERYPCVVLQAAGEVLFSVQRVLDLRDAGMGFDGFTWETADPEHPFSLEEFLGREELEDALRNQVFARSDTSEGRDKKGHMRRIVSAKAETSTLPFGSEPYGLMGNVNQ